MRWPHSWIDLARDTGLAALACAGAVALLALLAADHVAAVEEQGRWIRFDKCPHTEGALPIEYAYIVPRAIIGIGRISPSHFIELGDGKLGPVDQRIFEECFMLLLVTGRSSFIKGNVDQMEKYLELVE